MASKVRPPAQKIELTDSELTAFTGNLNTLTPEQRKRRMSLQRRKRRSAPTRLAARAKADSNPRTYVAKAKQPTRTGGTSTTGLRLSKRDKLALVKTYGECATDKCKEPCLPGVAWCASHIPKPRVKKVKAPQVMAFAVEAAVEEFLRPYFAAVGLEMKGFDAVTGEVVIERVSDGICIHGESKDGDIIMTEYPNLAAQVQIVEKLMDRVYGRPRQSIAHEGGKTPIKVMPVRSEERARAVADILRNSTALPPEHEGRHRAQPSEPVREPHTASETD